MAHIHRKEADPFTLREIKITGNSGGAGLILIGLIFPFAAALLVPGMLFGFSLMIAAACIILGACFSRSYLCPYCNAKLSRNQRACGACQSDLRGRGRRSWFALKPTAPDTWRELPMRRQEFTTLIKAPGASKKTPRTLELTIRSAESSSHPPEIHLMVTSRFLKKKLLPSTSVSLQEPVSCLLENITGTLILRLYSEQKNTLQLRIIQK